MRKFIGTFKIHDNGCACIVRRDSAESEFQAELNAGGGAAEDPQRAAMERFKEASRKRWANGETFPRRATDAKTPMERFKAASAARRR